MLGQIGRRRDARWPPAPLCRSLANGVSFPRQACSSDPRPTAAHRDGRLGPRAAFNHGELGDLAGSAVQVQAEACRTRGAGDASRCGQFLEEASSVGHGVWIAARRWATRQGRPSQEEGRDDAQRQRLGP